MPSDLRNALYAVILAAAMPACTVDNGSEDFLLRPAYPGGGGPDGDSGDDAGGDGQGSADGAVHLALIHLPLEDGLQSMYQPHEIFADGVPVGPAEPSSSIDAYTGISPGTHELAIFEEFHTADDDPEPFEYADEPTVTFDPIDFQDGRAYVLTSIGEAGAGDFTLEVFNYTAPAEGGTVFLWNLSPDPMQLLAWPEAEPCQSVGTDSYEGDPGAPVVLADVAPGQRTSVSITEPEVPLTVNDENRFVWPATEGATSMAIQFPRFSPAAQAELDATGTVIEVFSSFQLLGPPLYEVERDCD